MKKIEQIILDEQDKIQAIQQIPDESQKLFESITPYKGHTLFEINCLTGTVNKAEYEEVSAEYSGKKRTKVTVKDNCLYISCLNKKSAMKKYMQWLTDRIIQEKPNINNE